MLQPDEIRMRHMLDAAREAVAFSRNRERRDLDRDRMLVLSLVKAIEIVGEAASQVTSATTEQLPDVPWADVIGTRHRLVHAYFDVNLDIVWKTVRQDLPGLIQILERALPEIEP